MDIHTIHMLESLNFLQVLTLLLVALLFGKDTILPWMGQKFFGIKKDDQARSSKSSANRLEQKMDDLQLHFNHETTDLLSAIKDNTAATTRKLEEWEKYGTPPPRPK